jgi:hypothetical protein
LPRRMSLMIANSARPIMIAPAAISSGSRPFWT